MEGFIRGEARSAVRRSRTHREEVQRSKPEAMPPDEHRNEGTPSHSEGPYVRVKTFASFGAFAKGSRPSGRNHQRPQPKNGYVPKDQKTATSRITYKTGSIDERNELLSSS